MFGESSELASSEPLLWVGLCAGFLRQKGFEVRIIDADAFGWGPKETVQEILNLNPIAVGVGAVGANPSASSTPKMPAARGVLNLLKQERPDIKTVLFGIHPGALPHQTLNEETVDFVCRGEIMRPMAEFLRLLKDKKLGDDCKIKGFWYKKGNEIVDNGWAEQVENLDQIPFVAWDLLPMDKYRAHNWHCFAHIHERSPYAIIFTSLGCIFNCTYCNIHDLYGEKPGMRYRSPENVIQEIDYLVKTFKIKNFKFLDELFVIGVNERLNKRMDDICNMLIERNYDLNIWAYARIDTVNETILNKLKKAGINWICYGIESGSKVIRDKVSKGQFDGDRIGRAVKMTYDAGIHILGNFMFGLPNDDMESMQATYDLSKEINCEYANYYCTMAYPGSKLYEDAVAQGIQLPDDWMGYSQYSYNCLPMATKYLTSAQVLKFRDDAFVDYYSRPDFLKMIEQKFSKETVDHIHLVFKPKIKRKILEEKVVATAL